MIKKQIKSGEIVIKRIYKERTERVKKREIEISPPCHLYFPDSLR